jgi:hypothetical protein
MGAATCWRVSPGNLLKRRDYLRISRLRLNSCPIVNNNRLTNNVGLMESYVGTAPGETAKKELTTAYLAAAIWI